MKRTLEEMGAVERGKLWLLVVEEKKKCPSHPGNKNMFCVNVQFGSFAFLLPT